jgi:N-acetylneuraminic acid mutarotase
LLGLAVVAALSASLAGFASHSRPNTRTRQLSGAASARFPAHLVVVSTALKLPFPLQDAAAVAVGPGRMALLGGLNGADSSVASVSLLDSNGAHASGLLPEPQHDAQGALLSGRVYVFGGGEFSSYSHILAYDPASGLVSQAASLPTPTSDAAVAAIAGTAYVVGGYDGEQALDTIVAWRPGMTAHIVARLPYALRYAAAAATGGRLVIVGGSHGEEATRGILAYDPATGLVQHIGDMPSPITHAAAAALGSYVYVFGGRAAAQNSQSRTIFAIDPKTGRVVGAGALPAGLSDASGALVGGRIWLAGGLSASGTVASVLELAPARR